MKFRKCAAAGVLALDVYKRQVMGSEQEEDSMMH